jgi:hypothetical protein
MIIQHYRRIVTMLHGAADLFRVIMIIHSMLLAAALGLAATHLCN